MAHIAELPTTDGGVRQGGPDLWCTYAAIRTLTALGALPQAPDAAAAALSACRNSDGGYAWQKGLPSDVWATYYCTQALTDLGVDVEDKDRLGGWLAELQHESGGFAMTPGQTPDVWATYYATRTYREVLGRDVPRETELLAWLAALQREDGGLGWYPGAAESDVRACYYGAHAWSACVDGTEAAMPWKREPLVAWLQDRQWPTGGFAFDESSEQPCLWATFRAVRALAVLGAQPDRPRACVEWIGDRRHPGNGYHRWEDRTSADVWACFSAIGALQSLDTEATKPSRSDTVRFLHSCELPEGGFTYRATHAAGDSLATAAALLADSVSDAAQTAPARRSGYVDWLKTAHMPYEGGVMYMPGRGAEVRCTLWAVSALSSVGEGLPQRERLAEWFVRLQNKDGGFGYWHGRASDMVATVSALEALEQLGGGALDALDTDALGRFLDSCADSEGYRNTPAGEVSCGSTAQAARALRLIGRAGAETTAARLDQYLTSLKGASARPRSLPDLASTYQYHLAKQRFGLPVDLDALGGFVSRLRMSDGYAWSPLSQRSGGVLAHCLGTMLDWYSKSAGRFALPPLNL